MKRFSKKDLALSSSKRALLEQLMRKEGLDSHDEAGIPRRENTASAPLSFAQQRLWFINELEPGNPVYADQFAVRFAGTVNITALRQSVNEIIRRQEALRTTFESVNDKPLQIIAPNLDLPLPVVDLQGLSEEASKAEAQWLAVSQARHPFDLAQGPLLRITLLIISERENLLLFTVHHIISDGWSLGVFIKQMGAVYEAFCAGKESPLSELPIQYGDYANWQQTSLSEDVIASHLAYWKEKLADAQPVLELPADHQRPVVQSFNGATQHFEITGSLARSLRSFSQQHGVTLFMLLLGAFKSLLYRYTGQQDIIIGSPIAGRSRAELEELFGCFANVLVLRTMLEDDLSFLDLLDRVKQTCVEAYEREDMPFEKLVEKLQPERDLGRTPLFQVMFVLQSFPIPNEIADLKLDLIKVDSGTAKFDLMLEILENADSLSASIEYNTDLFDSDTIARMIGHLQVLLHGAVADPRKKIWELPLLTEREEKQILEEWNDTASEFPRHLCIHQLFESQTRLSPDKLALQFRNHFFSYHQLNQRSNQLAHFLIKAGARPESLISVCLDRSPDLVIALLAVLKAGAAYVPLDPAYPPQRIHYMLGDSASCLLITRSELLSKLDPGQARPICIDLDSDQIASQPDTDPSVMVDPANLAYIIYTSGSTGQPKGVAIEHRSAVALIAWSKEVFSQREMEMVLASTSVCFDLSVYEIFVPLGRGGAIAVVENALEMMRGGQELEVSLINTVPSAMSEIVRSGEVCESVETVNLAGEALSARLVKEVYERGRVKRVMNLYGPSEDTTYTSYEEVERGSEEVLIGRPVSNTRLYILDKRMGLVAEGVSGELYTGGEGLARCYYGKAEMTAERFIADVESREAGGRMYRTGDECRYRAGGKVEYVGRMDRQVKVRGYRIELGEVEEWMRGLEGVREAAVVVREGGEGIGKQIVGYVVGEEGAGEEVSRVRERMRERVPEYMVPSVVVVMERMPLTANGKIDRKALPNVEFNANAHGYVLPRNPVEEIISNIWASVLRLEKVGVEDNFFDIGGHSLLATQVVSRVRSVLDVEVSLRGLFANPTVAAMAEEVEAKIRAGQVQPSFALGRADRAQELPLSFAQQRLWFIDRMDPGSPAYNIPCAVRLKGKLRVDALGQSLNEIVRRHEALRMSFLERDGEPTVRIDDFMQFPLSLIDLADTDGRERERRVHELVREEANRSFDLNRGPLIRAMLLRLGNEEHLLIVTMHHIVSDGWSLGVMVHELMQLYEAYRKGKPSPLSELPIQYADFAVWQWQWLQSGALDEQLKYWKQQLSAITTLELPTDRPRPAVISNRGASEDFRLSAGLTNKLKQMSKQEGVTLFMTLLAGFQLLLARYSEQDDIAVGAPVAGRNRAGTEDLIGFFVNTLVMRGDLSGNPTVREMLRRVRETALGAYAHQDLPFEKVVEELQPQRDLSRQPLCQVMLALLNVPWEALKLSDLNVSEEPSQAEFAKFDLTLLIGEEEGEIRGTLQYATDLYDRESIVGMLDHLRRVLKQMATNVEATVNDIMLPITSGSKVKSKTQYRPEQKDGGYEAPRTTVEEVVSEIWAQVLRVDRVGIHDNFFDLGGHSLLATRIISRINEAFKIDLPLRKFFETPLVSALAEAIETNIKSDLKQPAPPIERIPQSDESSLSFAQQRIWFLDQLEPDSSTYNMPAALRLEGDLNIAALEQSFGEVLRRHEVLRARFESREGRPTQLIEQPAPLHIGVTDLSDLGHQERKSVSRLLATEEAARPFDLTRGPLLRIELIRLGRQDHLLVCTMHHIVSDGWSVGVLLNEVVSLYKMFSQGQPSELEELPIQYGDYARWQKEWLRGEALEQQTAYWKQRLGGELPVLELPTDRPRPAVQSFRGARHPIVLPHSLLRSLKSLSRREGVTLYVTLLAAFKTLLYRYTNQEDIIVGTPFAGRSRTEVEGLIGFFANTLAVRTDLSGNPSFRELIKTERESFLEAYANQGIPFEKLVEELQPERSLAHMPLFQVMFVMGDLRKLGGLDELEMSQIDIDSGAARFDLTVWARETEQGLEASWEYNADLYDPSTITRMARNFQTLLESIVMEPSQGIADLNLLTEAEKQQIVEGWNDTASEFPRHLCIHQLFESQTRLSPDKLALQFRNHFFSYHQLNQRSNQLAHFLIKAGARPESLISVCLDRSPDLVIALLAVLKAGAAYVPLDPAYPPQRIHYMLGDSASCLLITRSELLARLDPGQARPICIDLDSDQIASQPKTDPSVMVDPANLAYIIYTSGSTGQPKGVAIEHRSAVALIAWSKEVFSQREMEMVLASTSVCFDLSVYEIFVPLGRGGAIAVVENALEMMRGGEELEVSLINTVPSAMSEIVRSGEVCESVETVNLAGEALSARLVKEVYERGRVKRVMNLYGPSEDTTYTSYEEVERGSEEVLIGRPVSNTRLYILDKRMGLVAEGVSGELYTGGEGLARCYYGKAEMTAERFIADVESREAGGRMYRTGDECRYRAGGKVEYVGRMDRQVKVRGYRIELGEVEEWMRGLEGVREAAVVVREGGEGIGKQIVGYVVGEEGAGEEVERVRERMRERVPEYMVPSVVVVMERMPLTANGKIDRKALSSMQVLPEKRQRQDERRNLIEEMLSGIWAEVLGLEEVGVEDNFFDIGGHSLLATQIVSRVREAFGVNVELRSLFESASVRQLSAVIGEKFGSPASVKTPPLKRSERSSQMPLSFSQEGLWFIDQLESGSGFYNLVAGFHLKGLINIFTIEQTISEISRRHEVLRTNFPTVDGKPVQVVQPVAPVAVRFVDLSHLSQHNRKAEADRLIAEESGAAFDMEYGPLARFSLVKLADEEHLMVMVNHHIVGDAWSLKIYAMEVQSIYEEFFKGNPSTLPELSAQYADYALWQREWLSCELLEAQLSYWKQMLADMPKRLNLPADYDRPSVQTFEGDTQELELAEDLSKALRAFSGKQDVTLYMTLLTAFNVLLNYYSEQEDILVGSPSSHRDNLETEQLIGYFVNILIMRTDLSGDPTFKELLARTRETVLGAYTHKDLPFAKLVDEISPHRSLGRNPLLQVVFGLNNVPIPNPQLSTLTLTELPIDSSTVQWDLILRMIEAEDKLTASLQYSTNLYARSTAVRMLKHYEIVLNQILTKPEARLKEIKAALAEADRQHRIAEEEKAEQASLLKLSNVIRRASKRSQTEGDYR